MQWLGMREKGGRDEMFVNPAVDSGILKQVADDSINLISIFGAARQGKSFLMNVLANKEVRRWFRPRVHQNGYKKKRFDCTLGTV